MCENISIYNENVIKQYINVLKYLKTSGILYRVFLMYYMARGVTLYRLILRRYQEDDLNY